MSDLNLGPSEDEDDDNLDPPQIIREGISQFASLLSPEAPSPSTIPDKHSSQADNVSGVIAGGRAPTQQPDYQTDDVGRAPSHPSSVHVKKKRKSKRRQKPQSPSTPAELPKNLAAPKSPGQKKNKWADHCMYAELLELNPRPALNPQIAVEDGLPDDLDTGAWVAISGVPVGKRCLAITYASSGIMGTGTKNSQSPLLPAG